MIIFIAEGLYDDFGTKYLIINITKVIWMEWKEF